MKTTKNREVHAHIPLKGFRAPLAWCYTTGAEVVLHYLASTVLSRFLSIEKYKYTGIHPHSFILYHHIATGFPVSPSKLPKASPALLSFSHPLTHQHDGPPQHSLLPPGPVCIPGYLSPRSRESNRYDSFPQHSPQNPQRKDSAAELTLISSASSSGLRGSRRPLWRRRRRRLPWGRWTQWK